MMNYHNGNFFGMHFIWWIIWTIVLFWIFAIPYNLPYQRSAKENPMNILKRRYAKGEITKEEFEDAKKTLKSDN